MLSWSLAMARVSHGSWGSEGAHRSTALGALHTLIPVALGEGTSLAPSDAARLHDLSAVRRSTIPARRLERPFLPARKIEKPSCALGDIIIPHLG